MNFRDILLLTDLLQVSYFGLASTIFTPKCPSASVNQLFYLKYDSSNILNGINKLYFLFIKSIKLFKLNLLCIISINNFIPLISPIINLIVLPLDFVYKQIIIDSF